MIVLDGFMPILIRLIADWLVFAVAAIGAYALLRHAPDGKRYETYARVFMMGLTAYVLSKIAGMLYQPGTERPFVALGIEPGAAYLDNPGFPSDHALFVFAVTMAVWAATRHRVLSLVLLGLSVLVGVGRVLALVHTPVDVIGAASVVAVAWLLWYTSVPRLRVGFAKR